jgi:hypothetical protein
LECGDYKIKKGEGQGETTGVVVPYIMPPQGEERVKRDTIRQRGISWPGRRALPWQIQRIKRDRWR